MQKQVKILSGVSGSGKSSLVAELIMSYLGNLDMTMEQILHAPMPTGTVTLCSADNFFLKGEVYTFDPSKLSEAHGQCFRDYITALTSNVELVIVDNTNTTSEEIAPYILGAQAYGYEAEIITLRIPQGDSFALDKLVKRNKHGVGENAIYAQHNRLQNRRLPPWWKNTDMEVKGL